MAVTAGLVKDLRQRSGAGMMDCKKALTETDGNIEEAIDWLRTKGLATAAKKSGNIAAEGLVAVLSKGNKGAIVEINSQTDFVARNEEFQAFVANVAKGAFENNGDLEAIKKATYPGESDTYEQKIISTIATIGENMNYRRSQCVEVSKGAVASYIHNATAEGMGKIAVLVGLESDGDQDKLIDFGKKLAMHIAAVNPLALDKDSLDPTVVAHEQKVIEEQARESGKDDKIIAGMVKGRMSKFFKEQTLLEQEFVLESKTPVKTAIANFAKELGSEVKLVEFVRYGLGEGIEKAEDNFAEEVAKAAKG